MVIVRRPYLKTAGEKSHLNTNKLCIQIQELDEDVPTLLKFLFCFYRHLKEYVHSRNEHAKNLNFCGISLSIVYSKTETKIRVLRAFLTVLLKNCECYSSCLD
jgi:hypothetical protein